MKSWLLILCVLLLQCQEYAPKSHYLSTIIDLTEEGSSPPSYEHVLSHLDQANEKDGLELSLRYVCETRYADRYQFSLPIGETGWFSNEHDRRSKHKKLLSRFRQALDRYETMQCLRSEIFRLVAEEAVYLSKLKGSRQILLYSDLKQHSPLFSVYDNKQLNKLYNNTEGVADYFSKVLPEVDLTGITINILFSPKLRDDRLFTAMVDVYRKVLEPKGASVNVIKNHRVAL